MRSFVRGMCVFAAAAVLGLAARAATAQAPQIALGVDASEAPKRIFHVHETIPVGSGPVTLVYPKWIPGEHSPSGPITDLVGLKITAGGKAVPWTRQATEMWSFDVRVPEGVSSLEASFDYVAPLSGSTTATAQLAILNWWSLLLYPQGPKDNETMFVPSLKLPAGWKYATSLKTATAGNPASFVPVSLVTLIDSPVLAGAHFRDVDLTPGQTPGHWLHIAGETDPSVAISKDDEANYRRLVAEAQALFGARHYGQYHFLLALTDHLPSNGLEHHESSDNRASEDALTEDSAKKVLGTLLSHEYVHSWNGKYRRPAGLVSGVSADYQAPVDSQLLWVYEGLTEYYGDVLGARSGLRAPELYRENLALVAAGMDYQKGREWRPLVDTATSAQLLYDGRAEWADWRRGVDFYPESELIWLEADVLIRTRTGGKKSLDDFARAFYGPPDSGPAVKAYGFDDVVAALNAVAPNDWAQFFRERVYTVAPRAPMGGIENGGWKLMYTDARPELTRAAEGESKLYDFWYSLGIMVHGDGDSPEDGTIKDVVPGAPAARAGVAPGMRLIAVNGRRYKEQGLRDALRSAKDGKAPIALLLENLDTFQTLEVDERGGEKHPRLDRDSSKPDLVSAIGAPLTKQASSPGR